MRGLASLMLFGCCASIAQAAPRGGVVAVYWQPPGQPAPGERARAAFRSASRAADATWLDASEAPAPLPSLVPQLHEAVADYAGFRFPEAIAKLDALARLVDARGGGNLDARQLSEVFLYRGLSRLELGPADAAWEDLARAARLDPTRVIDPARFPPRVVAAYQRAIAEVARQPRAELELAVPADAQVRVDGRQAAGPTTVTLGQHFVSVDAPGYQPWSAMVAISGEHERVAPPLALARPPDGDRLLALTREHAPERIVLGALERAEAGWHFLVREIELPSGKTVSEAVLLGDAPVGPTVESAARRRLPLAVARAGEPKKTPLYRRWWIWTLAGGVAAALAVAIPVGVVYGGSTAAGSVGGPLGPLR